MIVVTGATGNVGRTLVRLLTWMASTARRLAPDHRHGPIRIPYDLVAELTSAVNLSVRRDLLPDAPLETWLRDHLIIGIPGASDGS
jgi:hypothetical protein